MTLYEVIWDNGEYYEDNLTISLIFTTLEKAKEYYNKERTASGYSNGDETLTLCSFESDIENQKRTKIESRILEEPDMDEFGTCYVADTY